MLPWYMYDETDYMVEMGYWVENRYPCPRDPGYDCESPETLAAEAEDIAAYYRDLEMDAMEARGGPPPRYFAAFDLEDDCPF